ncbi:uncharacterized protein OCT59_012633 [Rhizophagus irregularis]|uniref:Uncharacterized protein n=2 Tax=Rhizophagus irregularis TaxID=588596 RepID=A0A2N1MQE7_9GLOM|nr:hypothetical protein GLOIN_2v1712694 [Rhizophagus irregularis DAOM 181602=DAOM 197198]PKK63864.1 hypothetical protein RhiirC2_123644 [Rhizophagus irregularis]POG60512.1 hypothetical protein GLOIN_2v1712694 [Rhizophagus irregularis DAOM 181602=DAOM 197198]UZO01535.1 hypothetical protein OCT59_012633 [Rhizophagus irregularis]GBC10973.2 hypothetical protein GLOIN_2v1712694 [Rhizophagus irregularis DAOM 181602=DAOM 197198]|eukprot:XP_025167378.1 hypothetical protein GLOIN_2v1712694 [Rhizophagus irregularis DAOM 181602=DAOM 197198]
MSLLLRIITRTCHRMIIDIIIEDAVDNYFPTSDVFDFFIYSFLPFMAAWNYTLFKGRKAVRFRTFVNLVETNLVKYAIPFGCCCVNKDISFHHPMTYYFLALMSLDAIMIIYWILISSIERDLSIFSIDRIGTLENNCCLKIFHLFYLFVQVIFTTYIQVLIVPILTLYYFHQIFSVVECALFYGITLLLILFLSLFIWKKLSCYFAVTFFNFLFIALHIVLFISPNGYFTKAEIGVCFLYLSNMFKLNELYGSVNAYDPYLQTMFDHYQSVRWLGFWIFYSIRKGLKESRLGDLVYAGREVNFYNLNSGDRKDWWYIYELWDYKFVKEVQRDKNRRELYNAIIEYEMI